MKINNMSLLNDLNEQQKEAVQFFNSSLRIIAGPGSGKTKVLTRKVAYLINDLGITPNKILAVTFTNKAANEMSERIRQYCDADTDKLNISTFHALCAKILRIEYLSAELKSDFLIIDEIDKKDILSNIYKELNISKSQITFSNMIQKISWYKNTKITLDELAKEMEIPIDDPIILAIKSYEHELASKRMVDFDDLIIRVETLFDKHPEIAKKWSEKFSFILVDEFQDTSVSQYNIVKKLINKDTHITIVGDPDQTIYNWRGADVSLILDFHKDFSDTKTIVLQTNYRSTKKIVNAANQLIVHNKKRYVKDLITDNEIGAEIEFFHAFNMEAEARWVVQKINELKKNKIQLKNIAILYRSNFYSRPFEEALIKENINHKIFNGVKFFQREEIKNSIAFLRILYDGSDLAFERVVNIPTRGIGETTLERCIEIAKNNKKTLFNTFMQDYKTLPIRPNIIREKLYPFLYSIKKHSVLLKSEKHKIKISEVLRLFLEDIGYLKSIENISNLRGSAVDNVNELIESIKNWEEQNPDKGVKEYLEMVSLLSSSDEFDTGTNYVSLMTIHSAKGLEFDNVFIVGMSENIFPSVRSVNDSNPELVEEERRLAYVAVTRARKRLFISDSRGIVLGTRIDKSPSRFIKEMGIDIEKFILVQDDHLSFDTDSVDDEHQNDKIIVGDFISHNIFGEGEVLEVNNSDIIVSFVVDNKTRTLRKNHPAIKLIRK